MKHATSIEDLKPCPFCGSGRLKLDINAVVIDEGPDLGGEHLQHVIRCETCMAQSGPWDVLDLVVDAWERREGAAVGHAAKGAKVRMLTHLTGKVIDA